MFKGNKAQSTLEYVIILTAIIGALIAVVTLSIGKKDSSSGLGKIMNKSAQNIESASGRLANFSNGSFE